VGGAIRIGCSGYYYDHWVGGFYPGGTRPGGFFDAYRERFSTVELNTTFYHFPREAQVESWAGKSGEGFVFSVKAPRLITHVKKLGGCRESLLLFLHLMKPLKAAGKLGAILFQTPPSFTCDLTALEEFVAILPPGYRYAFEFRDGSWRRDEVYAALAAREADFAFVSEHDTAPFEQCIAPFKYFRLHGLGERYASNYSEGDLEGVAKSVLRAWDGGKREVFVYFNNDYGGYAPANAKRLVELTSGGP
jgi:uncharacterized protein YecE (DUF72 family)